MLSFRSDREEQALAIAAVSVTGVNQDHRESMDSVWKMFQILNGCTALSTLLQCNWTTVIRFLANPLFSTHSQFFCFFLPETIRLWSLFILHVTSSLTVLTPELLRTLKNS